MTTETITEGSGAFAKPAPRSPMQALAWQDAERREDDPPPEVPRDQWDRPIIVLPDGSGCLAYIRASKYGKLIRDQRKLHDWDERNVVWGMSRGHHLVARASGVRTLTAGPDIKVLQEIAEQAKTIAGAHAGAMSGSGMHALHARRVAGEDLSWLDPMLLLCLDAITALLDPRIFEILCTEGDDDLGRTFIIHDGVHGAGSFDLVVRLLVDLTWPDGVTIRRGTILVVDLKTGKITSTPYWSTEFSCQQLIYAEGVPYRPGRTHLADPQVRSVKNVIKVTEQPGEHGRITWADIGIPDRPSQRWSLILHVPVLSPGDAHWERVDLDEARRDAEAAKSAHARARVSRAERFLALPAAALVLPDLPRADSAQPVDAAVSTASEDQFNPRLHAVLRERIFRADKTDQIDAIYDSWGQSPTWDDQLTADCQAAYDRLTPPDDVTRCDRCNHDRHQCPGCGVPTVHGKDVCRRCELRLLLSDAPDSDTLVVLWEAHAPVEATELGTGDGLWDEGEHTPAAVRRDAELTAVDIAGEQTVPQDRPGHGVGPAEYPMVIDQVSGVDGDVITLWCPECLVPPGHPDADDPIAWCDCAPDETCMDSATACRNRAHDPEQCPSRLHDPAPVDSAPLLDDQARDEAEQTEPPTLGTAAAVEIDGVLVHPPEHPDDADPDDVVSAADESGVSDPGPLPDPGPFDSTMDLSDLRDLIDQALDTETLDALYDAHCAREEGGDGLWTDDLNAAAQARYDALSTGTGAES